MTSSIPDAVLQNMSAFATTSPTKYTDQIKTIAATLSDDSKASDDDKIAAYTQLTGLINSSVIYKAGNVADLQLAVSTFSDSNYAKSVEDVANQYQSKGVSQGQSRQANGVDGPNGYQTQLDLLNSFSQSDQKKLFVSLGYNQSYGSLDDAKAALQAQSDSFAAKQAAATPVVKVSLSSAAKAALGTTPSNATDPSRSDQAKQALANLTVTSPTVSKDAGALQVLQQAAEARAKALDQVSTDLAAPLQSIAKQLKPYTPGTRVDTAA